jgi:Fuc2NAc and GlcNAc transferase
MVILASGLAVVGFVDDHRHIAARWRLMAHGSAASAAIALLHGLPPVMLPFASATVDLGGFGYLLGALFLVWSLNLFNFMDGIDGIAASEATFVSAALAGLLWQNDVNLAFYALSLAVVCVGFLVWNCPPAKIFMGDVGSSFIGFLLGVLILLGSHRDWVIGIVGLILFAVFVVDATLTLLRRLLRGQKCYQAHCTHAYQHVAKRYQTHGHARVVIGVWLINLVYLLPLATIAFKVPSYAWCCLIIAYAPLFGLAYRCNAGIPVATPVATLET